MYEKPKPGPPAGHIWGTQCSLLSEAGKIKTDMWATRQTGNSGYPAYMVGTGRNRGPFTQVSACTGGH
jgi:hypothetical protein